MKKPLTKDQLLQIAAEVERGERPRSDLDKYGIKIDPPKKLDEAGKMKLLDELGLNDEDPNAPAHVRAHGHCSKNRAEILASERCGCFHCLAIFAPAEIKNWCDEGQRALCPKCRVDSIIGSKSGFPIEAGFLMQMKEYWFSR